MSNPLLRLEAALPKHYQEDYPKFVSFIKTYYDWLYRNGGFNAEEIDILRNEEDWFVDDVKKYYDTGDLRYIAKGNSHNENLAIIEESGRKNPGKVSEDFISDYHMDREFSFFETADGDEFDTVDEKPLESPKRNEEFISAWFKALSFVDPQDITGTITIDKILMIRVVKYFYLIKGTAKSVELFFNIFLDLPVSLKDGTLNVYLPKENLAVIDDNFIPDGVNTIRDDFYYNEYTYVVQVYDPTNRSKDVFDEYYRRYVHPSGFNVILENTYVPVVDIPDPVILIDGETMELKDGVVFERESIGTVVGVDRSVQIKGANIPRFGFDSLFGSPRGLFFEIPSENLLTQSSTFSNAVWTKSGLTVTEESFPNIIEDYDTTFKLNEQASAANKSMTYTGRTVSAGQEYSFSFAVKADGRRFIKLSNETTTFGINAFVVFDILNGVVVSKGTQMKANIKEYKDGWFRISWTASCIASGNTLLRLTLRNDLNEEDYIGELGKGIYLVAAQLEIGTVSTYIPTVSNTVQRLAERAEYIAAEDWLNVEQGSFTTEFTFTNANYEGVLLELYDAQLVEYVRLQVKNGFVHLKASDGRITEGLQILPDVHTKVAIAYAENGAIRMAVNGTLVDQLAPGHMYLDFVYAGNCRTMTSPLGGHILKAHYYPISMNNNSLQAYSS